MSNKPFYIVKRSDRLTNGKPTYYVRFRDEAGNLLPWRSTGETAKVRAELWALEQFKQGNERKKPSFTFGQYAENWWIWEKCDYIQRKIARGRHMSHGYADARRTYLVRHILPTFGKIQLTAVTPIMIEKWLMELKDAPRVDGKRTSPPLSPTTVNHCLTTLKIMLGEARRLEHISADPSETIEHLHENPKGKQILTLDEMRELLDNCEIDRIWRGDSRQYALNLLAASTGMRMGEIQGLQIQHLHIDHVSVVHSWERKYGLKEPKWNSVRTIPIPRKTSLFLTAVVESSGYRDSEDLVFAGRNARRPIGDTTILSAFYHALSAIGIGEEERAQRNVTFHSWRHLFNSLFRSKIPDYKLQLLTGHRVPEMTEHYTHTTLEDFADVANLQEQFIGK